jgi:hypothetical protein
VKTSHGIVETTVKQAMSFKNSQNFTINATTYIQDLSQSTTVKAETITRDGWSVTEENRTFSYPLTIHYGQTTNADGSFSAQTVAKQKYLSSGVLRSDDFAFSRDETSNEVASEDTLSFSSAGALTGHTGASSQNYLSTDSRGRCYGRKLTSVNSVLTGYTDGGGCPR